MYIYICTHLDMQLQHPCAMLYITPLTMDIHALCGLKNRLLNKSSMHARFPLHSEVTVILLACMQLPSSIWALKDMQSVMES